MRRLIVYIQKVECIALILSNRASNHDAPFLLCFIQKVESIALFLSNHASNHDAPLFIFSLECHEEQIGLIVTKEFIHHE